MALIESQDGSSTARVRSARIRAMFAAVAIRPAGDCRISLPVRSGCSIAKRAATQAPRDIPIKDAFGTPSASSTPATCRT